MAYYNEIELKELGFKALGENVLISTKASIYNSQNISIGSNVRIDDFCVLSAGSGGILIGSYIHIGVYTSLIGEATIELRDFSNISSKVSIYSSNDDYSGENMTNPMVGEHFTNVHKQAVFIGKHVIIGSGSVLLPGTIINEGAAIGALSLVKNEIPPFEIYAGSPARFLKNRSKRIIKLENEITKKV